MKAVKPGQVANVLAARQIRGAHIVMANVFQAKDLKHQIGQGWNFSKLAQRYSLDEKTKADGGEFNVALMPGRSIRIRVTDQSGEPVANAFVWPFKWPDTSTLTKLHNFGKTDGNGVWTWDWAPEEELAYSVRKAGYTTRLPDVPLRPGAELYELILRPERRVTVKVVDDAPYPPQVAAPAVPPLSRLTVLAAGARIQFGGYDRQDLVDVARPQRVEEGGIEQLDPLLRHLRKLDQKIYDLVFEQGGPQTRQR